MKRKQLITTIVVVLVLAALVYLQFRTWKTFDWGEFVRQTRGVNIWMILGGVALIYLVYFLRAIRWYIFLKPTHETTVSRLIAPQFIGFTGLALLGRPGEFVRPYLIAKKEGLTLSSQIAVWAVERVFDIGSVALLLGITLAIKGSKYREYPEVKLVGMAIVGIAIVTAVFVFALWWRAEAISSFLERTLSRFSHTLANTVCKRVHSFGQGLTTLQDFRSFITVLLLSFCIWLAIARAYIQVAHAYPVTTTTVQDTDDQGNPLPPQTKVVRLHRMQMEDVLLVMGASMAGSIVQLPGVGGGSQLAVIGLLSSDIFKSEPYNISRELAVSCGIMLWLVTFMSVIPVGLFLAHREHVSLKEVSEESEQESEQEAV